jgi:cyclohexyl-isocyanide hydratase
VRERVVVDRDRITGAGVTAGIDFAFRVVEDLHGREVHRR